MSKKIVAGALVITFTTATELSVDAVSYNPETDYKTINVRFVEDKKPTIDFYINESSKHMIKRTGNPSVGPTNGDWTMTTLARGMYMGADYINYIPNRYQPTYLQNVYSYLDRHEGASGRDRLSANDVDRLMVSLTALQQNVSRVGGNEHDLIHKISSSHKAFSQEINDEIWTLIALNTGGYNIQANSSNQSDWNSEAQLIDSILDKQVKTGGWSLDSTSLSSEIDVTAMAIQALAPYYKSDVLYKQTKSTHSRNELREAVEKGLYSLKQFQQPTGGFKPVDASVNAESIAQVIVALTELNIDPKTSNHPLPTIGKTVNFVTSGGSQDGVKTNNMIDALLTFWISSNGGFRHIPTVDKVNTMATDQATYALIAYQRYLDRQTSFYTMTDQKAFNSYKAKTIDLVYDMSDGKPSKKASAFYLEQKKLESGRDVVGRQFVSWNTKPNGSGISYEANEILSMPNKDTTLYAQYKALSYQLVLDANGGDIKGNYPSTFTVDKEIDLPNETNIIKKGYTFKGWNTSSNKRISKIEKGTAENMTLTAVWEKTPDVPVEKPNPVDKDSQTVIDLIQAIGNVTSESKASIVSARTAYNALSDTQQLQVTNYLVLELAEKKLAELLSEAEKEANLIQRVEEMIQSIGTVTLEKEEQILLTRNKVSELTGAQQRKLSNLTQLEIAEKELKRIKEQASEDEIALGIKNVEQRIDSLGEITLDKEDAIKQARVLFDGLTKEQQEKVSNQDVLLNAEKKIAELKQAESNKMIDQVIAKISELDPMKLDKETALVDALMDYSDLTDEQKQKVTNKNVLDKAQTRLVELKGIQRVEKNIAAIGTVTLEKEMMIRQANEAYNALSKENQSHVTNHNVLVEATKKLTRLKSDVVVQVLEKDILAVSLDSITADSHSTVDDLINRFDALGDEKQLVSKPATQHLADLKQRVKDVQSTEIERAKDVSQQIEALVLGKTGNKPNGMDNIRAVREARKAYNALTKFGRGKVKPDAVSQLVRAEESVLTIESIIKEIAELPSVDKLTVKDESRLKTANRHVSMLTTVEKQEVTNLNTLEELNKKMEALVSASSEKDLLDMTNITAGSRRPASGNRIAGNRSSKNKKRLPKTGEVVGNQLTIVGLSLLTGLYIWKKKDENRLS